MDTTDYKFDTIERVVIIIGATATLAGLLTALTVVAL